MNPITDSLSAKLKITFNEEGRKRSVDGKLFYLPNRRYILHFNGPLSSYLGTFGWTKDSLWYFYQAKEKRLQTGSADKVAFPGMQLDSIPPEALIDFLWRPNPRDPKVKHGAYTLTFGQVKKRDGKNAPSMVRVREAGRIFLTIQANQVHRNPNWKINPFLFKVPVGIEAEYLP